ncbi:MAG: hypothetical protein J7578_10355 [Chitinophagaceae bacterium]|nr:hypothetical protein [Chitinophagaceae bacterium]
MKLIIQSRAEYDAAMKAIQEMMSRGEDQLTEEDRSAFFRLAVAIERFEDQFMNTEGFVPDLPHIINYKFPILHG